MKLDIWRQGVKSVLAAIEKKNQKTNKNQPNQP